MKKKSIIILSIIGACSVATAALLAFVKPDNYLSVLGDRETYTIALDENNRLIDRSASTEGKERGTAKTHKGNDIIFECSSSARQDVGFIDFYDGAGELYNVDPINGLTKLKYKCNKGITLKSGFSFDNLYNSQDLSPTGSHSYDDYATINIQSDYGYPSYFKIECPDETQVFELIFYYSCVASPDPYKIVGNWSYTTYADPDFGSPQSKITDFSIDPEDIPADGMLVVPSSLGGNHVGFIDQGVLDDCKWIKHIVLPFVGQTYRTDDSSGSHDFGSIFSRVSGHDGYSPMTQHGGTWYVPTGLQTVTVLRGNRVNGSDFRYKIPDYGFYGATNLTQVNLVGPTSLDQPTEYKLEIIGSYAFGNCTGLSELYLPASITTVDNNAFAGCSKLIIRSYGEVSIGDGANPNYAKVTENYIETVISDGIIYDLYKSGDNVYANAMGKASPMPTILRLYRDVTVRGHTYRCLSIANQAFEDEDGIVRIILNGGMQKVGHLAFKGCSHATILIRDTGEDSSVYLSDWDKDTGLVVPNYGGGSSYEFLDVSYTKLRNDETNTGYIADSIINASATSIRLDMFDVDYHIYTRAYFAVGNKTIEEVYLPKDITMGDYSFFNCSELETIQFAGTCEEWETLVSNGRIGVNTFANTKATVIICSDGTEPVL